MIGGDGDLTNNVWRNFRGDIAEVLLYPKYLDDSQLNSIGSYLKTKWAMNYADIVSPPSSNVSVNTLTPLVNATSVNQNANLSLRFDQNIQMGVGNIQIKTTQQTSKSTNSTRVAATLQFLEIP